MRRFLIDLILIVIFVMLGRQLLNDADTVPIEKRIDEFNQKVERREVINHSSNLHLNQTEENIAGKIGNVLSDVIYETVYGTMEMIAMIFDENR